MNGAVPPEEDRRKWLLAVLFTALTCLLLIRPGGFGYDIDDWARWTDYIAQNGLAHVYGSGSNYLPLWLYVLAGFASFFEDAQQIREQIHLLKAIVLVFDFAIVFGVASLLDRYGISRFRSLWLLCNIAFLYITLYWGQVDSFFTAFVVLSFVAAVNGKPEIAAALAAFGLAAKLQAIVFIPPLALIVLVSQWRSPRRLGTSLLSFATPLVLVCVPFLAAGTFRQLRGVVTGSVGFHAVISKNAFGMWSVLMPGADLGSIPDANRAFGLSYQRWGLLVFAIQYSLLFVWMFLALQSRERLLADRERFAHFCLAFGLIPLGFFLFPTEMHERYIYPALPFFALFAMLTGRKGLFAALCVAQFANIEIVLQATILGPFLQQFAGWKLAVLFIGIYLVASARIWRNLAGDLAGWQGSVFRTARSGHLAFGILLAGVPLFGSLAPYFWSQLQRPRIEGEHVLLSSLTASKAEFGFEKPRINESWEGGPIRLAGLAYSSGLGMHSWCRMTYRVPSGSRFFRSVIGLADSAQTCAEASVVFRVLNQEHSPLFESALLRPGSKPQLIEVALTGVTEVTLEVTDGGDGRDCDHANWGEPAFMLRGR